MKLAIYFSNRGHNHKDIVERMGTSQSLLDHQKVCAYELCEAGAVSTVSTSEMHSLIPLQYEQNGNFLFISGVPLCRKGALADQLQQVCSCDNKGAANILRNFDGAFVAVYWDNQSKKLVIVTDFLGYQPFYIYYDKDVLLLATEIKAVTGSGLANTEHDLASWGAFFSLRHLLASHTFLKKIKRTEPASVYTYDYRQHHLSREMYWHWPEPAPNLTMSKIDTVALVEILKEDIRAYLSHHADPTVLLSGGFDSRLITAILAEMGERPKALIVSHPNEYENMDGDLAVKVAEYFHLTYEVKHPSKEFYSSREFLKYLVMAEISTPSFYLFIANVASALKKEMGGIWDGIMIGLMSSSTHHGVGDFAEYCKKNEKNDLDSDLWQAAHKIFKKKYADDMYSAYNQAFSQEKGQYSDDGFGTFEFAVRNWTRNRIAPNPYKVFDNRVLPFTPGMSKCFIENIARIPIEIKLGSQLVSEIYNRHFRRLVNIPVCSGGKCLTFARNIYSLDVWMRRARSRLSRNPVSKNALRLLGYNRFDWARARNDLVDRVNSEVQSNNEMLNMDYIQRLGCHQGMTSGKALLFYWQIGHLIRQGRANL
jgi:hypothetical protein